MPTKISSLTRFPVENNSSNLYALGYDGADTSTKTNYRINLKEFIDKQLESINSHITSINTLLLNFSDNTVINNFMGDVKPTVTNTISKLIDEINNIDGTTNSADITEIKNYRNAVEALSEKLTKLLEGEDINEDKLSITTKLGNLLNLIRNKIQYLDANIGTGSNNSGGQTNIDTSELEDRIRNVETAIGLNEEDNSNSIPKFPTYTISADLKDLETYNTAATIFNSDLTTYLNDNAAIINKSKAADCIKKIISEETNIANYFPITIVSNIGNDILEDANGNISYTIVDDKILSINTSLSIIKTLNENIKKFEISTSTDNPIQGEYINSLNEVEDFIKALKEQGVSVYEDADNLKNLLTNIKNDYDSIQSQLRNELVSSYWSNVPENIEGIDELIEALENNEILDVIEGNVLKVSSTINNIFINIIKYKENENDVTDKTIFDVVSIVETNIKNINDNLDSLNQLKITIDKANLSQKLLKNYEIIKDQFNILTLVDLNNLTNNTAINEINVLLNNPAYDSNVLSAAYIEGERTKANELYTKGIKSEAELAQYIECIKNIYKSKSFVKPKNNDTDQTAFNNYFNNLEKYSNQYNCYWKDTISSQLIDISETLDNIILISFISKFINGKYLETKILESAETISENIYSEVEVIKNNLITLSGKVTNSSGVTYEDLDNVAQNVTSLSNIVVTLDNKVTNEIPARINIETNKVRENLDSKIAQQTNDITNFKNNIQNYNGFIRFDEEPETITVDEENVTLTLDEQNYYKLEVNESGILYIIKGEATNIKFIPYTKDNDNNLNINDFYKNLYCSEEGLNVPFITISILKNNGILLPEGFTEKFYFIPYLSITEIYNIIKE